MEEYAYEEDIRYKDIVEKKRLALLAQMRQLEKVGDLGLMLRCRVLRLIIVRGC